MDELTKSVVDYQQTKCIKKRNKIINNNGRLINYFLKKYNYYYTDDLYHESVIVFMSCVDSYKSSSDISFISFLFINLKSKIFQYTFYTDNLVTLKNECISYKDYKSNTQNQISNAKSATLDYSTLHDVADSNSDITFNFCTANLKRKMLSRLAKEESKIMKLKYFSDDEYSIADIAKLTNKSSSAVKSLVARAKGKIKSMHFLGN